MRLRILVLAALIAAAPVLLAQRPAWQPGPEDLTLHLWPHGAPGEPAHPAPEVNTPRSTNVLPTAARRASPK